MNTKSSEETDFPLKLEGNISSDHDKGNKASSSSSSAQWLRLKDPRIVRVSRAFGGKDRHSKVCTVRGLRDRRVRLSVSTAIQLYDLQDRLGFNQPSKVVDWLLNAAKDEIDELPPLQMPPSGSFSLCPPSAITSRNNEVNPSQPDGEGLNINESGHNWEGSSKSKVSREMMVTEKENWNRREEDDRDNLLSRANHPSFLGLLNTMPLGYNNQWEPSGGDVTHSGSHGFTNQADLHSINVVPFPASSTLSLSTGTSQFLVCPPAAGATQSYFPGSHSIAAMDMDPRQINQYQMLGSSSSSQNFLSNSLGPSLYSMSQSVKPFSLSMMTPKLLHSPNSSESQSHKDRDFPSK